MIAVTIDIVIVLLLAGSVGYAAYLSSKVRRLMMILNELEPVVAEFSNAVDKSEKSACDFRESVKSANRHETSATPSHSKNKTSNEDNAGPRFASSRKEGGSGPGVHLISDKKELVKMFFGNSNLETEAL